MRHFSWLSMPWGIRTNRIKIIRMQLIKMFFAVFFIFFFYFKDVVDLLAPTRIVACVF